MKNRRGVALLLGVLALGSILAMAACGPSVDLTFLGDGGNTGGTGVGPVAGFGSVIVNGVRYDDAGIDNTTFFDVHGRTKADLTAGMMVKVTATGVNDVSGTGTATKIEVLRHVDGPLDDNGVTLATNRMKVMGQTVVTDTTTVFDNVVAGGLIDLAAIDNLAKAGKRPELEIHGIADNTGTIHATFIRKWFDNVVTGRDVQVKGTVANDNVAGKTFTLGTATVSFAVRPAGLGNGVFVEVKGTFRTTDNTVVATTVTVEDPAAGQGAGDLVKAEGYVNRIIADGCAIRAGRRGRTAVDQLVHGHGGVQGRHGGGSPGGGQGRGGREAEPRQDGGGEGDLVPQAGQHPAGDRRDREVAAGRRAAGVADPLREDGLRERPDAIQGQRQRRPEDVQFQRHRRLPADRGHVEGVGVSGQQRGGDADRRLAASSGSARSRADANILQGIVEAKSGGALFRILGITVQTFPGTTEFLQADGTPFPGATANDRQANFFAAVIEGRTVVKARGTAGSPSVLMTANEVRIRPTIDN